MASRYHSPYKERRLTSPGGAAPARPGVPGAEAAGGTLKERTAPWPSIGPTRKGGGFNRTTKMPVVKTRARKDGID